MPTAPWYTREMLWWYLLTLAGLVVYAGGLIVFAQRCPRLETDASAAASEPHVTIIVPARNEERFIGNCVEKILAQDYSRFDVIVVNDGSTDETGAILARLQRNDGRLTILEGRPLPSGWLGKNNALDHASQHARGSWLLFVDADVELHPHALTAAIAAVERYDVTFLSAWPRQVVIGFWEQLVQPVVIGVTLCANALRRVAGPPFPEGVSAWGQFILVETDRYRELGGHSSVADRIVDDTELLHVFREFGDRPITLDGTDVVSVRMYRDFMDLWFGWTKNIFPSLGNNLLMTAVAIWWVALVSLTTPIALIASVVAGRWAMAAAWLALVPLYVGAGWFSRRHVAAHPALGLNPVGGAVYLAMIVASAYRLLSGRGVTWKGRRYGSSKAKEGADSSVLK